MTDVADGLSQEARQIAERIPKDMTEKKAEHIAEVLRAFMVERMISQSAVAKKLGISSTQVSQFLSGKYKGDLDGLINKVVNYINSVTRKERRVRNEKVYIETSIAKRVQDLIAITESFSDVEGKIGIIVGDGGHGKSHCLRQYAEANKNSLYVELDDCMSMTQMFAEIARQLHLDSTGTASTITRKIIDALESRQMIIMLDEASSLTVSKLNKLRQIIAVKGRCPLILSGNCDLLKTVMQPNTRKGYECLDQFTSRLSLILNLDDAAGETDGGLYTVSDIRELYEYGGIRLTKDAVTSLRKICMTPRSGRLRTCSHLIAALHTSKVVIENCAIDRAMIIAAIDELDLPIKVRLPVVTVETAVAEESRANATKAG